ncbi:MAG TPA: O-methyltransferase [Acidimicrobiia bacterium]|nr:O-methyltransferase [Acidimicrobiia bacterium]
MEMTPARWEATERYASEVFGHHDEVLRSIAASAQEEGLPPIAVSAEEGRLLMILASLTRGRLAVEVGSLGGYSGTWLTRGLDPAGRLITIEADAHHADVAEAAFRTAGIADRVEVRRGRALDVLPGLAEELGPESVDVVFVDAEKVEYPDYFRLLAPLVTPGGLYLADNVYGTGGYWIDRPAANPGIAAIDEMNRMVAGHRDFEAVAVPIRSGLLIARKR